MNERRLNIGLVTLFDAEAGDTFLLNLVKVLSALSSKLYVLSPNTIPKGKGEICNYPVPYNAGKGVFAQAWNQVVFQFRVSYNIVRLARKTDLWIFFGGEGLLLPMLAVKASGRKANMVLAGWLEKEAEFKRNVLYKIYSLFKKANCRLADGITVYSPRLIDGWKLQRYRSKISIAGEHFLDFNKFKREIPLSNRPDLLGYIGRLDEEKGILSLLEAIPKVLEGDDHISFLIGGDGPLRPKVEEYLKKAGLKSRVSYIGWIPHNEMPGYLNKLKLLVLPSYTEGISNVMLEAMACGTPVLATPVGAILDVITDEQSGFIIEDNSPNCIARNIIKAIKHPELKKIAENGRTLVEKEFSYEKTVEKFRNSLAGLNLG
jgi:glycosyltransferase involved in cell wall biosynthesis